MKATRSATPPSATLDPVEDFFDGDYPIVGRGPSVNLDEAALTAGVLTDIPWYVGRARERGGRALDVGAGSGRIALPLAMHGLEVTAVEPNDHLRRALEASRSDIRACASLDDVPDATFDTALLAHGVLTSVVDADAQQSLLVDVGAKLRAGGSLLFDLQNPMLLRHQAVAARPTWIRVHPERGTRYARTAGTTAMRFDQTLELVGRYEEEGAAPRPFSLKQRLVYPNELRMMLDRAGLTIDAWGGSVFGADPGRATRWFLVARKRLDATNEDATADVPRAPWIPAPPEGVGATSLLTAAARTKHHFLGGTPVFDDPYAMRLSGELGLTLLARSGATAIAPSVLARTYFFDARTQEALDAGIERVLMLGIGMCTRSLRVGDLSKAKITVVDHPASLAHRRALLADTLLAETDVPLDVSDEASWESLREHLSTEPTLVLAEGLLPYLSPEKSARFLRWMDRALCAGSYFVFDTLASKVSIDASLRSTLSNLGTAMVPSPEAFSLKLSRHRHAITPLRHPEASFGLPLGTVESTALHVWIPE